VISWGISPCTRHTRETCPGITYVGQNTVLLRYGILMWPFMYTCVHCMVLMLHSSAAKSCALVKTSFIYFVIYLFNTQSCTSQLHVFEVTNLGWLASPSSDLYNDNSFVIKRTKPCVCVCFYIKIYFPLQIHHEICVKIWCKTAWKSKH
jgi:hypothetical protein